MTPINAATVPPGRSCRRYFAQGACGPDDADVKEVMSGVCGAELSEHCRRRIQQVPQRDLGRRTVSSSFGRRDAAAAVAAAAQAKTAQRGAEIRFLAGGTTLVDLMKLNVETPSRLIDINRLPPRQHRNDCRRRVEDRCNGPQFGSRPPPCRAARLPVLSQALLSGASTQLRNMATTAGNLLQRTRCVYFRDTAMPCNKREPRTGCSAITGANRTLAILGTSEHCIATNPSDMGVAMAALEATIHIQGQNGARAIPITDFHLLPGTTPHRETVLEPGDLITHVTLRPPAATGGGTKQIYLKLRDRASPSLPSLRRR